MVRTRWLGFIAIACLLLCIGVGVAHYFKYRSAYQKNVSRVIETSQFQLRFTAQNFSRLEAQITSTIELTNRNRALDDYVSEPDDANRLRVEEIWLALANYQNFFRNIRFVDRNGLEKIKVAYSSRTQSASVSRSYSHFGKEYAMKFAESLSDDEVANMAISLEEESSESGGGYVPVQHVIIPFTQDEERKGYIVLTIDIWLVKSILDYSPQPEFTPLLLTSSGDYVAHPDPSKLFGFSIPGRKIHNLGLTHHELWQDMMINGSGITENKEGLFVYRLIDLSEHKSLYALIHFTKDQLSEQVAKEYSEILEGAILIMFLILIASIPFAHLIFDIRRKNLESSLALAALNGMSAVVVCDSRYQILKVNSELEKMTGFREEKILHSNIRKLFFKKNETERWFNIWDRLKSEHYWEGELRIRKNDGNELFTITRVQALVDEQSRVTNYIISLVDISERKVLEERLRYLSERDELSQLWNRRKFEQEFRSDAMLYERYPENHQGCLALLDIDNFKRINDEQGHDEGDRVIRIVSATLSEQTRRTDVLARIGGEEFAIIMRHTTISDARMILERIRSAIEFDISHSATISIGFTDLTSDTATCYKCADIALYESKSLGRNRVSLCHSTDDIA